MTATKKAAKTAKVAKAARKSRTATPKATQPKSAAAKSATPKAAQPKSAPPKSATPKPPARRAPEKADAAPKPAGGNGWGGIRKGQGRRAVNGFGQIIQSKPRYVTLTENDSRKLRLHGGGSLTTAVRKLVASAIKQKRELNVVVSAAGRGQGVRVRDNNGERIPLLKYGVQLDQETVDRLMDYSQGGLSAGLRKLAALLDEKGRLMV